MTAPTRDEALKLLKEARCPAGVIDHCLMVTKIAMRIAGELRAKGYNVDLGLVEAGAILHDIGRSVTHGVEHGAIGGQIARRIDLNDAVARIIERHVGAGLTAEEAEKNGIPRGAYIPETLEEKVVCYADKLTEGDHETSIEVEAEKLARELGARHLAVRRLRRLHAEMSTMLR